MKKILKFSLMLILIIMFVACTGAKIVDFNNKLVEIESKLAKTFPTGEANDVNELKKNLTASMEQTDKTIKEVEDLQGPAEAKEFKDEYIKYYKSIKSAMAKLLEKVDNNSLDANSVTEYRSSIEVAAKTLQDLQQSLAKKYNFKVE